MLSSLFLSSLPSAPASQTRAKRMFCPYLLVISKVVPKIWARTNSAMAKDVADLVGGVRWKREGSVGDDGGGDEVGGGFRD